MFTGIVEEIGIVKNIEKVLNGYRIFVQCSKVLENVNIGDSICVNGICLTVTNYDSKGFWADVSPETFNVTNFSDLKSGSNVNLERALTLNSRLGGHIVSGHIDCVGKIIEIEKLSDFYNIKFEIPEEQTKYVVYKGSIAINGVSLTVADIRGNKVAIAVIPHTFENTAGLKIGQSVNIETDILAKYVEKMLSADDNKNKSKIDEKFLIENGFV